VIVERHRNAATVGRDDDGHVAAIPSVEQAQADSPCAGSRGTGVALRCPRSLAARGGSSTHRTSQYPLPAAAHRRCDGSPAGWVRRRSLAANGRPGRESPRGGTCPSFARSECPAGSRVAAGRHLPVVRSQRMPGRVTRSPRAGTSPSFALGECTAVQRHDAPPSFAPGERPAVQRRGAPPSFALGECPAASRGRRGPAPALRSLLAGLAMRRRLTQVSAGPTTRGNRQVIRSEAPSC
jgi:hypothetical protein